MRLTRHLCQAPIRAGACLHLDTKVLKAQAQAQHHHQASPHSLKLVLSLPFLHSTLLLHLLNLILGLIPASRLHTSPSSDESL